MEFPNKGEGKPVVPPKKEPYAPVVSGAVRARRPIGRRIFNFMFAESPKTLGALVSKEVIVPRLKAGFEEAANSFLAGMLWGNSANRPMSHLVRSATLRGNATNYSARSQLTPQQQIVQQAAPQHSSGNYEDLILRELEDAEMLLVHIIELLSQYNVVCVGDLYEKAGIITQPSDSMYGWLSLQGARISKVREGYLLELPRPTLI